MIVVVNGQIFDPEKEPILIFLNRNDKENIKLMDENSYCYIEYNKENYTKDELIEIHSKAQNKVNDYQLNKKAL